MAGAAASPTLTMFLVPDLSMLGYVANTHTLERSHSTPSISHLRPTVRRRRRVLDWRTTYSFCGELIMKGLQAWEMGFRGRYLAQVNFALKATEPSYPSDLGEDSPQKEA